MLQELESAFLNDSSELAPYLQLNILQIWDAPVGQRRVRRRLQANDTILSVDFNVTMELANGLTDMNSTVMYQWLLSNYEQNMLGEGGLGRKVSDRASALGSSSDLSNMGTGAVVWSSFQLTSDSPAPSASPTFGTRSTAAPEVLALRFSPSRSSVLVDIDFVEAAWFAGYAFCSAVPKNTLVSSVDQVISSATVGFFLEGSTSLTVEITGLQAVASYDVYCYLENILGQGNSLNQTLSTGSGVETACCRSIRFNSAPNAFYGNLSLYSVGQRAQFLFLYSLSSLPDDELTVEPVLRLRAGTQAALEGLLVTPSSATFDSDSFSLSNSFTISGSFLVEGEFTVFLQLTGPGSGLFVSDSANFTVLSSSVPTPPPILSLVRFSDDGSSLHLQFDSPTNQGGQTTGWPCSNLFSFVNAEQVTCSWLNSSFVRGDFGSFDSSLETLEVGDPVTLLPDSLQSRCSSANSLSCDEVSGIGDFSFSQTVIALSPTNPVTPQIALNVPSTLSNCQDLVVDASLSTGHGGRQWSAVAWVVSELSGKRVTAIQSALDSQGSALEQKITISNTAVPQGSYSLSLIVTNFFGKSSSQTVQFAKGSSPNTPGVTILGPQLVSIHPGQSLTLYSRTSFSACATSRQTTRSWTVSANTALTGLKSVSKDPSVFFLPAYSLTPRSYYQLRLAVTVPATGTFSATTGSALVNVRIVDGLVQPIIQGGTNRYIYIDDQLTLDASASYDENLGPGATSGLSFMWSCSVLTQGSDAPCTTLLNGRNTASRVLQLSGVLFLPNVEYLLRVQVTARDGRSAIATQTVELLTQGNTFTSIETRSTKVNVNNQVTLTGYVQATYSLAAQWLAFNGQSNQPLSSLTFPRVVFNAEQARNLISYPIRLRAGTLTAGTSVTFRIEANVPNAVNDAFSSFSEITLQINGPPRGGTVSTTPASGFALFTAFEGVTLGWTDDLTDYPLTFSFLFRTRPSSRSLLLQSRSAANTAIFTLPEGLESQKYFISVIARVFDVSLASANVSVPVSVTSSPTVDLVEYVNERVTSLQDTQEVDSIFGIINNAAVTINAVNCSLASATYCSSLNRADCERTTHTCSDCLDGFSGLERDANSLCFSESDPGGDVGSQCSADADCFLGNCGLDGVCEEPLLLCPTTVIGQVCSGRGACIYQDSSGNVLTEPCTVNDPFCSANCDCEESFGGASCALNVTERVERDVTRLVLCSSILSLLNQSDPSPQLMDGLVDSLRVSYSSAEVYSSEAIAVCREALLAVSNLAADGYLVDSDEETTQALLESASEFVVPSSNVNSDGGTTVDAAMTRIVEGIKLNSVNGQLPTSFASSKIQVSLFRTLLTNMVESPLTADSATRDSTTLGAVYISSSGALACDNGEGYVEMVVTQWRENPFAGAAVLESPQLRIDSDTSNGAINDSSTTGQYYFVLPFLEKQNFSSFLTPDEAFVQGISNATFPLCTTYTNGSFEKTCEGCTIAAYTNYNVTYNCSDISQLCSGASVAAQTLESQRRLQDFVTGDDDGGLGSAQQSSIQYAAFFGEVENELRTVLSTNPFRANWETGRTVYIFVIVLAGTILLGFVVFKRWDHVDRAYLIYGKNSKERAQMHLKYEKMKELDELIHNGTFIIKGSVSGSEKVGVSDKAVSSPSSRRVRFANIMNGKIGSAFSMNDSHQEMGSSKKQGGWLDSSDFSARNVTRQAEKANLRAVNNMMKERDRMFEWLRSNSTASRLSDYETVLDEEEQVHTVDDLFILTVVSDFLQSVMPEEGLHFKNESFLWRFLRTVWRQHDYTAMFGERSLIRTRTLRWMTICLQVMVTLFIDTLFYGIFFPDDGSCELQTTEETCLLEENAATGEDLCRWQPGATPQDPGTCSLSPPPSDFVFLSMLLLLTIIVAVPLEFLYDFVLLKFCSRRPDFDQWGLSTELLLGRTTYQATDTSGEDAAVEVSQIKDLYRHVEESRQQVREQREQAFIKNNVLSMKATKQESLEVTKQFRKEKEMQFIARQLYNEHLTASDEADAMLRDVKKFLDDFTASAQVPWHTQSPSNSVLLSAAKFRAIQQFIGIFPDGSPVPLSLPQRLWYGSRKAKLVTRITDSRVKAKVIQHSLMRLGEGEVKNRDIALIQYFILEQFSSFKQYVLSTQLFSYSVSSAEPIDPIVWLLAWAFVLSSLLFYIYWVLAWGAQSQGLTLDDWAQNFALAIAQDIFVIQMFRIFIVYNLSMISIRPQLKYIYRVLNRVAIAYTHDDLEDNLHEINVVQHLSPACRAARLKVAEHLATGKILRHLNDADIEVCRTARKVGLVTVVVFTLSIPVLVGVIDVVLGDIALEQVLSAAFSSFLLANFYLYQVSFFAVLAPYMFILLFYLWKLGVMRPARKQILKTQQRKEKEEMGGVRRWILTRRISDISIWMIARAFCSASVKGLQLLLFQTYQVSLSSVYFVMRVSGYRKRAGLDQQLVVTSSTVADPEELVWEQMNMQWELQAKTATRGDLGPSANKSKAIAALEDVKVVVPNEVLLMTRNRLCIDLHSSNSSGGLLKGSAVGVSSNSTPSDQTANLEGWEGRQKSTFLRDLMYRLLFNVQTLQPKDKDTPLEEETVHLRETWQAAANRRSKALLPIKGSTDAQQRLATLQPKKAETFLDQGIPTTKTDRYKTLFSVTQDPLVALRRLLYHYRALVAAGLAHSTPPQLGAKEINDSDAPHMLVTLPNRNAYVHADDLLKVLGGCWERFHPGGAPLTPEEQQEVLYSFNKWVLSEGVTTTQLGDGSIDNISTSNSSKKVLGFNSKKFGLSEKLKGKKSAKDKKKKKLLKKTKDKEITDSTKQSKKETASPSLKISRERRLSRGTEQSKSKQQRRRANSALVFPRRAASTPAMLRRTDNSSKKKSLRSFRRFKTSPRSRSMNVSKGPRLKSLRRRAKLLMRQKKLEQETEAPRTATFVRINRFKQWFLRECRTLAEIRLRVETPAPPAEDQNVLYVRKTKDFELSDSEDEFTPMLRRNWNQANDPSYFLTEGPDLHAPAIRPPQSEMDDFLAHFEDEPEDEWGDLFESKPLSHVERTRQFLQGRPPEPPKKESTSKESLKREQSMKVRRLSSMLDLAPDGEDDDDDDSYFNLVEFGLNRNISLRSIEISKNLTVQTDSNDSPINAAKRNSAKKLRGWMGSQIFASMNSMGSMTESTHSSGSVEEMSPLPNIRRAHFDTIQEERSFERGDSSASFGISSSMWRSDSFASYDSGEVTSPGRPSQDRSEARRLLQMDSREGGDACALGTMYESSTTFSGHNPAFGLNKKSSNKTVSPGHLPKKEMVSHFTPFSSGLQSPESELLSPMSPARFGISSSDWRSMSATSSVVSLISTSEDSGALPLAAHSPVDSRPGFGISSSSWRSMSAASSVVSMISDSEISEEAAQVSPEKNQVNTTSDRPGFGISSTSWRSMSAASSVVSVISDSDSEELEDAAQVSPVPATPTDRPGFGINSTSWRSMSAASSVVSMISESESDSDQSEDDVPVQGVSE